MKERYVIWGLMVIIAVFVIPTALGIPMPYIDQNSFGIIALFGIGLAIGYVFFRSGFVFTGTQLLLFCFVIIYGLVSGQFNNLGLAGFFLAFELPLILFYVLIYGVIFDGIRLIVKKKFSEQLQKVTVLLWAIFIIVPLIYTLNHIGYH